MNIFLDLGHPAYYHALKNFIAQRSASGDCFFIAVKDKEHALSLISHDHHSFFARKKTSGSLPGKAWNIISSELQLILKLIPFKPNLFLSFSSPISAHLAWLFRKPCITLEDTECAGGVQQSYRPFSTVILTPSCFTKNLGKSQLSFQSYKELAYLHPHYFIPDPEIKTRLGLKMDEPFCLLRFVSWTALHDKGYKGLSAPDKKKIVDELEKHLKVFISSEIPLPENLKRCELKINPWEIHQVLAEATVVMGESSTMAAEAAVLGTPSIFLDDQGRGYTNELDQKYGLIFNFGKTESQMEQALELAISIMKNPSSKKEFHDRRQKMLTEKIDLTAFLCWFVQEFPSSIAHHKNNPEYQFRFR